MIKLNGTEIAFEKFPNGEFKLVTSQVKHVIKEDNDVHFKFESHDDLIKLMFLKSYMDQLVVRHTVLTIYYMPYSRMDRSMGGQAFTLKYTTDFINKLNFTKVAVVEPHSDVTPALFTNGRAIPITERLLPLVMNEVAFDLNTDYLVFPDAGAQKRYQNDQVPNHLVGFKKRNLETGAITHFELVGEEDDFTNKKAIIMDDLCSFGGTFQLTATALREKGFKEVYLLVAHAEDNIFEGKIFKEGLIDRVYTTDSLITKHTFFTGEQYKDSLKVFELEPLLLS